MFHLFLNWIRHSLPKNTLSFIGLFFIIALVGIGTVIESGNHALETTNSFGTDNTHVAFAIEVYDTILESYWNSVEEKDLADFYQRISTQILGHTTVLQGKNRVGLILMLEKEISSLSNREKQKDFTVTLSAQVLAGLEPAGRSNLFTKQAAQELSNRVNNINPESDLYKTIGVEKDASVEQIAEASAVKKEELRDKAKTDEVAQKTLEKIEYAENVLSDIETRKRYDSIGAEPTVFARNYSEGIAHIYIERFAPSTQSEFISAAQKIAENKAPAALILDLRGNIGGSLDIVPYLLGSLIGPGNHAFSLFSKTIQDPILTPTGWLESLSSYKKIILLADSNTQSSGEVFLGTLKKYNVGVFLGEKTRGWGTVERIFPIEHQIEKDTQYGIFLVHSLTLNESNQPIEGVGISPDILLSDDDWKEKLKEYWDDISLIQAVENIWEAPLPNKY